MSRGVGRTAAVPVNPCTSALRNGRMDLFHCGLWC